MNLANNLKNIRDKYHLSQEQFAFKLGVSRQSVSKWESNQAYPEMDKLLQICQTFNVNIDDLLNKDIREVNERKQEKANINKFINDFFDYITKSIDLFSSITLKQKLKCFIEQIMIILILIVVFAIVGMIGNAIIVNLFSVLPRKIYQLLFTIIESIYFLAYFIFSVIILLYIFKIRYLDYYVIVKKEAEENQNEENKKTFDNAKIHFEKRQEKIIIRDPNHSEYRFISILLKCILFLIKVAALFIMLFFCIPFVLLLIFLILSFMFIKTGVLFLGVFLSIIGLLIINFIVLYIFYHFIINSNYKKKPIFYVFISSLLLIGIGWGLSVIGISNFNYVNDLNSKYYVTDKSTISMSPDLIIHDEYYDDTEYIETDSNDILISVEHSKKYSVNIVGEKEKQIHFRLEDYDYMNLLRTYIDDINNKRIVNYDKFRIKIYTSKENIDILNQNKIDYFNYDE